MPTPQQLLNDLTSQAKKALRIMIKYRRAFGDLEQIEEESKRLCTLIGESQKIVIPDMGVVSVSPAKEARPRGWVYTLNVEAYLALGDKERKSLNTMFPGLVHEEAGLMTKKDYGRFSCRPYPNAKL